MKLFIGVDIGGTNTRVALGNGWTFEVIANFKSDSTRVVVAGLEAIALKLEGSFDTTLIRAACMDAAGRVTGLGTQVEVTNYREGPEHRNLTLNELPASLFPRGHSRIINDLESACYGISGLNGRGKINDFFKILLGPKDDGKDSLLHFEHCLWSPPFPVWSLAHSTLFRSCHCCRDWNGSRSADGTARAR